MQSVQGMQHSTSPTVLMSGFDAGQVEIVKTVIHFSPFLHSLYQKRFSFFSCPAVNNKCFKCLIYKLYLSFYTIKYAKLKLVLVQLFVDFLGFFLHLPLLSGINIILIYIQNIDDELIDIIPSQLNTFNHKLSLPARGVSSYIEVLRPMIIVFLLVPDRRTSITYSHACFQNAVTKININVKYQLK